MAADLTGWMSTLPMYGNVMGATMANNQWDAAQASSALSTAYNQGTAQGLTPQQAWQGTLATYYPGQPDPYAPKKGGSIYGAMAGLNPALAGVAKAYQKQTDAANLANENRYAQINQGYSNIFGQLMADQTAGSNALLGGYQDLRDRTMAGLEGLGEASRGRIADRYAMEQSQAVQSLMSRGLGNTTVTDAVRRGLIADETKSYMDLDEQLRRERIGYDTSLSGQYLNALQDSTGQRLGLYQVPLQQLQFQTARTDQAPDPSGFMQLAQQMGQAEQQKKNSLWQGLMGGGMIGASLLGGNLFSGLGNLFK